MSLQNLCDSVYQIIESSDFVTESLDTCENYLFTTLHQKRLQLPNDAKIILKDVNREQFELAYEDILLYLGQSNSTPKIRTAHRIYINDYYIGHDSDYLDTAVTYDEYLNSNQPPLICFNEFSQKNPCKTILSNQSQSQLMQIHRQVEKQFKELKLLSESQQHWQHYLPQFMEDTQESANNPGEVTEHWPVYEANKLKLHSPKQILSVGPRPFDNHALMVWTISLVESIEMKAKEVGQVQVVTPCNGDESYVRVYPYMVVI